MTIPVLTINRKELVVVTYQIETSSVEESNLAPKIKETGNVICRFLMKNREIIAKKIPLDEVEKLAEDLNSQLDFIHIYKEEL